MAKLRLPAALLCAATVATSAEGIHAAADTKDLLVRYAAGDFAVVEHSGRLDVAAVRRDLERYATSFLAAESERPDLPRRVLAAFAFEVARGALPQQFNEAVRLLNWTRQRVITSASPATEFDRHWHLATIALLFEAGDQGSLESAADLAVKQFPDEPRFQLASAVAAEMLADAVAATGSDAEQATAFESAVARFARIVTNDAVRIDAAVHLAYLDLLQRRHDSMLKRLEASSSSDDPWSSYMVSLLRGRALAALGRRDEAENAYRAALKSVPRSQSATTGLAMVLVEKGDRTQASDLVDAVLRGPSSDDPWWHYWDPEFRFRERRLADLRNDLK